MTYESRRDEFGLCFILVKIPQRTKSSEQWEMLELGCEPGEAVQEACKICPSPLTWMRRETTAEIL